MLLLGNPCRSLPSLHLLLLSQSRGHSSAHSQTGQEDGLGSLEESCCDRGKTLCWGFLTGTQLSQVCLSPSAYLLGQLVASLGEQMCTASGSCFLCAVFHFQGCRMCQPVTAFGSAGSLPPGDANSQWRDIGEWLWVAFCTDRGLLSD